MIRPESLFSLKKNASKSDALRANSATLKKPSAIKPVSGSYGIGHTRWATHGRPTEENAHPHRDCKGEIVVVHNGIVENYLTLRKQLTAEGHTFKTETDTEVIAHLVEKYSERATWKMRFARAEADHGVFAISVIASSDPEQNRGGSFRAPGRDRAG